jgi:hypothetical protein
MSTESAAESILADWEDTERHIDIAKRQLARLPRGSDDALPVRLEIDRLIDLWAVLWLRYQDLAEHAKSETEEPLPPWPHPANRRRRPAVSTISF